MRRDQASDRRTCRHLERVGAGGQRDVADLQSCVQLNLPPQLRFAGQQLSTALEDDEMMRELNAPSAGSK